MSPFHHVVCSVAALDYIYLHSLMQNVSFQTHLEVRGVFVSSLTHLSKLRSQLKSLVLDGQCLESGCLDEALVGCGGDRCQDSFLWSELHSLHVTSSQTPLDLGSGLQLAPWLKTLDLSSSGLVDNDILSLTTLLTLHSLQLDFNRLQKVPVLAPSARSSLKVLHLRQNQLESLRGLEELSGLEELDVAYNCLSSSESLSCLCSLPALVRLCLEFNPVSYSKDYRVLVVRRISTAINKKKFLLDGQPLSGPEKDAVGTMASLYSAVATTSGHHHRREFWSPPVRGQAVTAAAEETVTQDAERVLASLDDSSVLTESPVNHSGSFSSGPLSLSAQKQRKRASRMREVEIVEEPPVPVIPSHQPETTTSAAVGPSNGDHLTTKQRLEELRRTFGQDNWLHSQAGNEVRQLLGWQEVSEGVQQLQPQLSREEAEIVVLQTDVVADNPPADPRSTPSPLTIPPEEGPPETEEEEADVHVFLVRRCGAQEDDGQDRLLTVSEVAVAEKDSLSGRTLASWKRSGLQSITPSSPFASGGIVRFQMQFQQRAGPGQPPVYSMDDSDFAELEKLLATDMATNKSMASNGEQPDVDMLSCIKCDSQFPAARAAVKLRTVAASNGYHPHSSTPVAKGQLEEYSACPHCGSDMVFAVCVSSSSSSSASSSSSGRSSDVMAASVGGHRLHGSPGSGESSSSTAEEESEEGSVEVVDKSAQIGRSEAPPLLKSFSFKPLKPSGGSIKSASSGSSRTSRTTTTATTAILPATPSASATFVYSYADFSQVDHRLRLYCEMFLLGHQAEEFHGLVKAELIALPSTLSDAEATPQPALLVVTSHKLYFLRITTTPTDQPEKWLNLEATYPLSQLIGLSTVIGHQGLALQLGSTRQCWPYLLLLGDQRRTKNVAHFLLASLEKSGLVVPTLQSDLMASQWTALDGLVRGSDDAVLRQQGSGVFLFCTVRIDSTTSTSYPNAALMVTSDRMALIRGDPRWLLGGGSVEFRRWGVSLVSLQQVVNLISLVRN